MKVENSHFAGGSTANPLDNGGLRHPLSGRVSPDRLAGNADVLPELLGTHPMLRKPLLQSHHASINHIGWRLSTNPAVEHSTELVHHDGMENRIKELREAKGWSQEVLAEKSGTTNQQIGRLENGQRELTVTWMERLAKPLGVAPPEIMAVSQTNKYLRLIGDVQAGIWKEPLEENEWDGEWIATPLSDELMKFRPFALRVSGNSMDRVYPIGTILVCCHLDALQEEPISGKRYIIEDEDEFGRVETTVKEFVIDENGRAWAWPRSSDKAFQEPIPLDVGRDGHTIRVRSKVVYSIRRE